jgi:hypothetical protein
MGYTMLVGGSVGRGIAYHIIYHSRRISSIFYGQGHQLAHRHHSMTETHQSHKATKLRLLEIVEFSIKSRTSAPASLLPLVTGIVMQCKSVVMKLEAKEKEMTH